MRRWWVIVLFVLAASCVHLAAAVHEWPPPRWSGNLAVVITKSVPWPGGGPPAGYPPRADDIAIFRGLLQHQKVWRARHQGAIYHVHRTSWGWPLASLTRTERYVVDVRSVPVGERVIGPTRAGWSGLLLNTALYAAAPWGALLALGKLCRYVRRPSPGCCVRCGYDLVGLAEGTPCPECGEAARRAEVPA